MINSRLQHIFDGRCPLHVLNDCLCGPICAASAVDLLSIAGAVRPESSPISAHNCNRMSSACIIENAAPSFVLVCMYVCMYVGRQLKASAGESPPDGRSVIGDRGHAKLS